MNKLAKFGSLLGQATDDSPKLSNFPDIATVYMGIVKLSTQ